MERWKAPLYGGGPDAVFLLGSILPLCPTHQLFEGAWDRVVRGDAPRYEEPS